MLPRPGGAQGGFRRGSAGHPCLSGGRGPGHAAPQQTPASTREDASGLRCTQCIFGASGRGAPDRAAREGTRVRGTARGGAPLRRQPMGAPRRAAQAIGISSLATPRGRRPIGHAPRFAPAAGQWERRTAGRREGRG